MMTFAEVCMENARKAQTELYKICDKPRDFRMSIPPHPNDSDMLLDQTITDAMELAQRLEKACKALRIAGHWCIPVAIELEALV